MEIIIIGVIVLIGIYTFFDYRKKLTSGCCGNENQKVKKIKVKDRNPAHYNYKVTMKLDGMICSGCATKVENALNSLEGVYGKVNFEKKEALVYSQDANLEKLKKAVQEAGYFVIEMKQD